MFEDIPVDIGVIYEGERIRKHQMYIELGGPKVESKFEVVKSRSMDEVEDEKITVIGPDLKDLEPGGNYPYGIWIDVAGKEVEEELGGVIERRVYEFCNYIEGFMHLNQRYDIWLRLSKKSFEKGLNSFKMIGKVLYRLFKSDLSFIEKIQITFVTDPEKAKEMMKKAPSTASKSYGRPFLEVFKEAKYDFYKIDPGLFAPAVLIVNNVKTGNTFKAGKINVEIFKQSIGC